SMYYDNPAQAIDWLCNTFGFEVRLKVEGEDGGIMHSELTYGEALVMVSQSGPNRRRPQLPEGASPQSLGGRTTHSTLLFVDNVDAHCEHARGAGAKIVDEPSDHDYGPEYWTDRSYGALDL